MPLAVRVGIQRLHGGEQWVWHYQLSTGCWRAHMINRFPTFTPFSIIIPGIGIDNDLVHQLLVRGPEAFCSQKESRSNDDFHWHKWSYHHRLCKWKSMRNAYDNHGYNALLKTKANCFVLAFPTIKTYVLVKVIFTSCSQLTDYT